MKVVAIDRFEYASKLRLPGDEFDTDNDEHARLLELAKRVRRIETRDLTADATISENRSGSRNRYKHRALKAEE